MHIAGVDEVGRGPLAGRVVAAAVILKKKIPGLTDSKRLSEKKREYYAERIKAEALAWSIAHADVSEIDEINILQASLLAMQRAVLSLSVRPDKVLVDGNKLPDLPMPAEAIVKGDLIEPAISAASVLAKVTRDKEMVELHYRYPDYGFISHKGYPTKQHLKALAEYGVLPEHRRSFAPVKKHLSTSDA